MQSKRVLTIQDISCVGQCSLTVALPIISACGVEACPIPSAVLSTHTGGFKGYTFRDLTDDIPAIEAHWKKEGLRFDAIYSGYLGNARQIDSVLSLAKNVSVPGAPLIVDPAMADNGKLYVGFDTAYVECMKKLIGAADIILPNLTEACCLTDSIYEQVPTREGVSTILRKLSDLGAKAVVLTGIGYEQGKTGVVIFENGQERYYEHRLLPNPCHGTGDIYASAFVGALMNAHSIFDSAKIAADYTVR